MDTAQRNRWRKRATRLSALAFLAILVWLLHDWTSGLGYRWSIVRGATVDQAEQFGRFLFFYPTLLFVVCALVFLELRVYRWWKE